MHTLVNVLIIDDHPLFVSALKGLLTKNPIVAGCDTAGSIKEALKLIEYRPYGMILLDLGLPGLDGFTFLKILKQRQISSSVVVVSSSEEPEIIKASLAAGAVGFIPKSHRTGQMRDALNQVLAGNVYMPAQDPASVPVDSSDPDDIEARHLDRCLELGLTDKHYRVLCGLAEGLTNKQIAQRLFVSVHTVKAHNAVLYKTLNSSNRLDTVMEAISLGLLSR
jgi:DNA-binding NarL/FixJ family response regulator